MGRWSDLAQWVGPTANQDTGRGGVTRGLVVHIADGYYAGTIAWQHNPAAQVSSHFVVGRAGQVAQVVDTDDRAWCQSAGNSEWLSAEFEGFSTGSPYHRPGWESLTPEQVEAAARLLVRAHVVYGVPLQAASSPSGLGLGHHSMGGAAWGGHTSCPGTPIVAQKGSIVARAQAIAAPVPAPAPNVLPYPLQYPPNVYGDVNGPDWMHGGWYQSERPAIRQIQARLQQLGFAPNTPGWVDGIYERPTTDAVIAFQVRHGLEVDGLVGPQTWKALFS